MADEYEIYKHTPQINFFSSSVIMKLLKKIDFSEIPWSSEGIYNKVIEYFYEKLKIAINNTEQYEQRKKQLLEKREGKLFYEKDRDIRNLIRDYEKLTKCKDFNVEKIVVDEKKISEAILEKIEEINLARKKVKTYFQNKLQRMKLYFKENQIAIRITQLSNISKCSSLKTDIKYVDSIKNFLEKNLLEQNQTLIENAQNKISYNIEQINVWEATGRVPFLTEFLLDLLDVGADDILNYMYENRFAGGNRMCDIVIDFYKILYKNENNLTIQYYFNNQYNLYGNFPKQLGIFFEENIRVKGYPEVLISKISEIHKNVI